MKTFKGCILIIILFMVAAACSPEPVFRLQSEHAEENMVVYRGMEYLISEGERSTAILAYYRHMDNLVIMDLEVINYSEEHVRFEPSDVSFKAYMRKFERGGNPAKGEWENKLLADGSALDPEQTLLNIDKRRSEVEARNRTNSVLEGISASLNLVSDISAAGKETASEQTARETQRTREAINRAERRENFYRNVSSLSEQRAYWETEALRVTDLQPGEAIAGEISLPLTEDALLLEIFVQIAGEEHLFQYIQRKFIP
ncbi:MAG: hypothetical protein EA390_01210 [Balneolaceae bacterium]|nr:MAG: hypothetical protein EA390_01210 [Balneolaceae bacterium]